MHATGASCVFNRERGGGSLGPGSYNVPITMSCVPNHLKFVMSPDEKRRKPKIGLDFQSRYNTPATWSLPKGNFVPRKGQEADTSAGARRRELIKRKNRNMVFPGPSDYENTATAEAWVKRTMPDATARGLLPRNGGLPEDENTPMHSPKFKNKNPGGNPGFRECAWFAKDGGLRLSLEEGGGLRWPAIEAEYS